MNEPAAKRMMRWMCILMIAVAPLAAAQTPRVVDLAVTASLTPPGPLTPGSTVQLQLNVTNNGPDTAPVVSAVSVPYPFLQFEQFSLVPSTPNPCQMFFDDFLAPPGSGQPSFLIAQVVIGSLASGQSRTCTLSLIVAPQATGEFDLAFRVFNAEQLTTDTNSANDSASITLAFGSISTTPAIIPATGTPSILLLLALVLGVAIRLARAEETG